MSGSYGSDPRAMYQGSRLHLAVNRYAAEELADVLSAAARDPSLSPMLRQLSLLLPDGREFDVSVQVTDTGAVYDEHGEWRDDDGRAYADISGDFRLHLAARGVVDSIDLPYEPGGSVEETAAADEQRIRAQLNYHLPAVPGDGNRELLRDDVYRRAMDAADATRAERMAEAARTAARVRGLSTGNGRRGRSQ